MEVGLGLIAFAGQILKRGFDGHAAHGREEDGFHIIPVAAHGIDTKVLPVFIENLLDIHRLAKVDQHHLRAPGDLPASKAAGQTTCVQGRPDRLPFRLVGLLKSRVLLQHGTQHKIFVATVLHGPGCFGADDRVDTANKMADFPAHLKKIIRHVFTARDQEICSCRVCLKSASTFWKLM